MFSLIAGLQSVSMADNITIKVNPIIEINSSPNSQVLSGGRIPKRANHYCVVVMREKEYYSESSSQWFANSTVVYLKPNHESRHVVSKSPFDHSFGLIFGARVEALLESAPYTLTIMDYNGPKHGVVNFITVRVLNNTESTLPTSRRTTLVPVGSVVLAYPASLSCER